jgi:hypothetical protein
VQFAADADGDFIQEPFFAGFGPALLKGFGVRPAEAQARLTGRLVADTMPRVARINETSRKLRPKQ